ncbi:MULTISPECIES: hypothetical protein [unclassified Nocardiopsis]|uniref:hypothetical protein n=1 Tax=unclassified Nocardiopsis TaxID=2649073 RepID=UPI00135BD972|nr:MULTISPECIES: hypothetical protein [unclassified Nocardiopsis]
MYQPKERTFVHDGLDVEVPLKKFLPLQPGRRGGTVMRLLSTPLVTTREATLRLAVIDDGPHDGRPVVPAQRTAEEWENAGSGRGLLLIHSLAREWGTYRMVDLASATLLGTALWAEFRHPRGGSR